MIDGCTFSLGGFPSFLELAMPSAPRFGLGTVQVTLFRTIDQPGPRDRS